MTWIMRLRCLWFFFLFATLAIAQRPTTDYPVLKYDPATGGFVPATTNGNTIGIVGDGASVSDTAFAGSWNGVTTTAPSKNAVYDRLHLLDVDDDGTVDALDTNAVTGLTADASPDGAADYVMTYDASGAALKKVLLTNLPGGAGSYALLGSYNTFTKGNATTPTAVSSTDIDWSTSNIFSKTLAANTTFTFSNTISGQTIVIAITNTASNYSVTWPTVLWSGGVSPSQTVGAKTDIWTFVKVGSTIYGSVVQNF